MPGRAETGGAGFGSRKPVPGEARVSKLVLQMVSVRSRDEEKRLPKYGVLVVE
ncbi:hypothetical protein [Providencia sp. PROV041]|uniref:hypothetical protein n=1 Tax=Providencia sp. PROV041 TaxID=2949772 RepID=UPI0023496291|nr:hypothetical protein [Providencia sp. PROV041]